MPSYECTVLFDASSCVTVEADNAEDAAHKAESMVDGHQSLCHQCSDTLNTGDSFGVIVHEGDEMVLETTWHAQQRKRDTELIRQMLEALEEATTYTSSPLWSPSMTRDCEIAITAARKRLDGVSTPPEQPATHPPTVAACITRLEQGGQSAAVSILRHHFEQKGPAP